MVGNEHTHTHTNIHISEWNSGTALGQLAVGSMLATARPTQNSRVPFGCNLSAAGKEADLEALAQKNRLPLKFQTITDKG